METKKNKKSPLYYGLILVIFVCFILEIWPNILGWNTADPSKWVFGVIPLSQFCIYLFPLLICLCIGGLYLLDKNQIKQDIINKKKLAEGDDLQC